jgi:hypothetical protein
MSLIGTILVVALVITEDFMRHFTQRQADYRSPLDKTELKKL